MLETHGNLEIYDKTEAIKQLLEDEKIQNYVWNKLFKRELFENIRFPVGRNYEDITVGVRLFEKSNRMVLKEVPKYYYVIREDSITKNKTIKSCNDYMDAVLERYLYVKKNIPNVEEYNDYNFITCAIWIYTILVTYEFKELEDKYQELFVILTNIIEKQNELIWNKLNYYRKAILSMMLFDKNISKKAIKHLYLAYEKERRKGIYH